MTITVRTASLIVFFIVCMDFFSALGIPQMQSQANEKLNLILESISKTSPEGIQIIEEALDKYPVVNGKRSTRTLLEIIEEYSVRRRVYNINPIGWYASRSKNHLWRIVFYYQDYQKEYQSAEWQYEADTKELRSFESKNAPQFWTSAPREETSSLNQE